MPSTALCLTLLVSYAAIGAGCLVAASVLGGKRIRSAAALFAIAVLVPWANFELLPAAGSFTSIAGSVAVAVIAGLFGWGLAAFPRMSAGLILLLAAVANFPFGRAAGGGIEAETMVASGKPNLLLILVDTLRADHLGVYGYERPTSPRIDGFAEQATRFDRAVAQAAWTKPSVASIFTGRYVHRHGVTRSLDALGDDLPTLAEVLRRAGYRTVAFSANPWITPEFRFSRGFDEFESGRAMGPQLTNLYRTARRIESLSKRTGLRLPLSGWVFRWAGRENSGNAERDEAQAASVIEWLRSADQKQPFFLYVHMIGPHDPYDPPREFAEAFARSSSPAPRLPPPRVQTTFEHAESLDREDLVRLIDQYDAAIAHADSLVGQMLDQLAALGLAEDTVVVVTSDHGEEFYEHSNWRHGNQLYDEVVKVPLLFRIPGGDRGVVRHDPAQLVDILPTALDLLGVDAPDGTDGRALFPEPPSVDQATLSEHWWFDGGNYVAQAVARSGLKLQSTRDQGKGRESEELFDLFHDRHERTNLLDADGYPESDLAALRALLGQLGGSGVSEDRETLEEIDPTTRERLRRLGYFDDEKRN